MLTLSPEVGPFRQHTEDSHDLHAPIVAEPARGRRGRALRRHGVRPRRQHPHRHRTGRLHRQRRAVQRIRVPRHRADRRQAGHPGRLRRRRTRAASTSAPGRRTSAGSRTSARTRSSMEWDFYGGFKKYVPRPDWISTSARSTTTTREAGIPASTTPTPGSSTRRWAGSGSPSSSATACRTTSACAPTARRATARTTWS